MSKLKIFAFCTALSFSSAVSANITPLNVYTEEFFSADWGPGPEIKKMFEQTYSQCHLNLIPFDSRTTMLNRLRLEGKKTKADLVLGLDNYQLEAAKKSGLFAPNQVDLTQLALPITWDSDTFLPYDFGQYAFVYDKTKLDNPPKSLKELVERQDLKVIYQDPRTSSVGRGLLVWLNQVYEVEQVPNAWKTLAQHTVTVGKGWTESYGAFLKGEADLVLSYTTSPLYHLLQEQKSQYAATMFEEGSVLQIETAAKLAKSEENECAELFLSFLLTPAAQKEISIKNVMLPVIAGEIEPHFDALRTQQAGTRILGTDFPSSEQLKQWIDVWQSALIK
ncbi:thiamine ABC transporter substrate binding subunit [Conservatibacter flavescens]|uniref:Thiamine-binding periplasmic protein n=1 Tax=Conservatibacter flavescens TaxID=28161 RepID=A0A2M8S3Y2_9PAST|nr:thiamine ABC transporter substrate binding subunit [Conservatibacter flavescens]PJG85846.1 thiamine ABC transporter substrate binding subunit [Conservatibacter flavescens]